jgi:hypothetical protein
MESGVDFKAKDIDLLVAMRLIINSLKNISNSVIINCFRKALFKFEMTTEIEIATEETDEQFWSQLSNLTEIQYNSFDSYVDIDQTVCTSMEADLTDDEIIQEVYASNSDSDAISDSEVVDTPKVTISEAMNHLNRLQIYFWQNGNNSFDEQFSQMQSNITNNTFNKLKQTKIVDYFN